MATSLYSRKRPSLVRSLWTHRKLVGTAAVLGVILWFIWVNGAQVEVSFPFGLGTVQSGLGVVILASAILGGLFTALAIGAYWTARKFKEPGGGGTAESSEPVPGAKVRDDDLPPPDYGSKTSEGFSAAKWS